MEDSVTLPPDRCLGSEFEGLIDVSPPVDAGQERDEFLCPQEVVDGCAVLAVVLPHNEGECSEVMVHDSHCWRAAAGTSAGMDFSTGSCSDGVRGCVWIFAASGIHAPIVRVSLAHAVMQQTPSGAPGHERITLP